MAVTEACRIHGSPAALQHLGRAQLHSRRMSGGEQPSGASGQQGDKQVQRVGQSESKVKKRMRCPGVAWAGAE